MSRAVRFITLLVAVALVLPLASASAARRADRNHDGLPDRWERVHHLSLHVNQALRDQDRDGLVNRSEFADHTDPRKPDSDGDGTRDGDEDHDGDGVSNEESESLPGSGDRERHEGVRYDHVVSFDPAAGMLELGHPDGTTLRASVTDHTLLLCAAALPGPFQRCPATILTAGAKLLNAQDETDGDRHVWTRVLVLAAPPTAAPEQHAPAPSPPVSGEPRPAPAITASVVGLSAGVLKIHRAANGEEPEAALAATVVIRCVTVASGLIRSDEPCTAEQLVPGAQLAFAAVGATDGRPRWVRLTIVLPAPAGQTTS